MRGVARDVSGTRRLCSAVGDTWAPGARGSMGCDRDRRRDRVPRARRRRRGMVDPGRTCNEPEQAGGDRRAAVSRHRRCLVAAGRGELGRMALVRSPGTSETDDVRASGSVGTPESAAVLEAFDRDVLLSTGRSIRVRPSQPADIVAMRRFYDDLSDRATYFRFFGPRPVVLDERLDPTGGQDIGRRVVLDCSRRRRRGRHRRIHPRARAVGSRSGVRSGRQPPARGDRHAAAGGLGADRMCGRG